MKKWVLLALVLGGCGDDEMCRTDVAATDEPAICCPLPLEEACENQPSGLVPDGCGGAYQCP